MEAKEQDADHCVQSPFFAAIRDKPEDVRRASASTTERNRRLCSQRAEVGDDVVARAGAADHELALPRSANLRKRAMYFSDRA
jgi:hypothetical protein